jgi:methionyl-tRNA formyltransferase
MKIAILCSDPSHPVNSWLENWRAHRVNKHDIKIHRTAKALEGGDILFLVACAELVPRGTRATFRHTLVLHTSDLPEGRGWSPHIWALLNGADQLTVSLIEAADRVDTGAIWRKRHFAAPRHALYDELDAARFATELALMDDAIAMAEDPRPVPQPEHEGPTLPRRTPADSEIDPDRPINEQFDLIRVSNPERYPAFFRLRGWRYAIHIRKLGPDDKTPNS